MGCRIVCRHPIQDLIRLRRIKALENAHIDDDRILSRGIKRHR